jgi:hypothetical protein
MTATMPRIAVKDLTMAYGINGQSNPLTHSQNALVDTR